MLFKKINAFFWLVYVYLALTLPCLGQTLTVTGQRIIDKPTFYKDATLDLNGGSFLITNNATLELENTTLNGTISPLNPFLIKLTSGKLILKNSYFNVRVSGIPEKPHYPSIYYALMIQKGQVDLVGNSFTIDKPYTVGLLITSNLPTSDFIIQHNRISLFHGAFFLIHSSHALISDNQFFKVSQSNILTKDGSNHVFKNNIMLLSADNGMDILGSKDITLSDNHIFSSACYSLLILGSQALLIKNNYITGGKTYAIYIATSLGVNNVYDTYFSKLFGDHSTYFKNSGITILHNYLAQNRYGLTADTVSGLEVRDNYFIQRFLNDKQRKFWTNNDILLKKIDHLTWSNNFYKEAFSQSMHAPVEDTLKLLEFPLHGGVSL